METNCNNQAPYPFFQCIFQCEPIGGKEQMKTNVNKNSMSTNFSLMGACRHHKYIHFITY